MRKTSGVTLSKASPYEVLFGTRHRRRGRPDGSTEVTFDGAGVDPVIRSVAKRRAFAVVHEENRARLKEVYEAELKVLGRRGAEVVARDAGVALKTIDNEIEEAD
jgi:hypothetical protein